MLNQPPKGFPCMRALVALLVVAPLALAGCSSPPAAPEERMYNTIPRPVNVDTSQPCIGFVGDADLAGVAVQPPNQPTKSFSVFANGAKLGVPEDATTIILDLWWENGAATAIRSIATGPNGAGAASDSHATAGQDNPVRLRFDDPAAGDWEWTGIADPVAAGVVLHFNYGLYYESPESLSFLCNAGNPGNGDQSTSPAVAAKA